MRCRNPNKASSVKTSNVADNDQDLVSTDDDQATDDTVDTRFWPQFDVDRQRYLHIG